jgi:hypothetical protein
VVAVGPYGNLPHSREVVANTHILSAQGMGRRWSSVGGVGGCLRERALGYYSTSGLTGDWSPDTLPEVLVTMGMAIPQVVLYPVSCRCWRLRIPKAPLDPLKMPIWHQQHCHLNYRWSQHQRVVTKYRVASCSEAVQQNRCGLLKTATYELCICERIPEPFCILVFGLGPAGPSISYEMVLFLVHGAHFMIPLGQTLGPTLAKICPQ